MISLRLVPQPLRTVIYGHPGYLLPRRDGTITLGGTSEDVGFDIRVTAEGLHWLLDAGKRLVPAIADATYLSSWSGLRPGTPDGLPVLGPVPGMDNLMLATGHYRNGILLSPLTGELVTKAILDGETEPLKPFSVARFTS